MARCKHGMFISSNGDAACAMCKDWPSPDRMRQTFPNLPDAVVYVMTPEERMTAMKSGQLSGISQDEILQIIREIRAESAEEIIEHEDEHTDLRDQVEYIVNHMEGQ